MATVLLQPGRADVTDVVALQAAAVVEVDLLSGDTAALAACDLVTSQISNSSEIVAVAPSTLTRNQVLDQLRQMTDRVRSRSAWPPT